MRVDPPSGYQRAEISIPIVGESADIRGVRHLDIGFGSTADIELGRVVARVREGLRASHSQLRSGRHVEGNADTIRFVLECIADATKPKR